MAINRKAIGDPGLNDAVNNTNRSNEYLWELAGVQGSLKYRQMSRGDDTIGMILRVHKNPIRSAAWQIQVPDDATDLEKEAIDILKRTLFGECGNNFDTLLGQILSCLDYGFSTFEQYYKPYTYEGNLYLVPVIEQRMQTSIQDIFPADEFVRQMTITKGLVEIPFDDLIFFVLDQQGEDMRGTSLLRNAYGQWKKKKIYQEWLGIGIQRSVSGIPAMQVPKGTKVDSADYLAAEQLLQGITQHENAYMITQEGWEFQVHESKFNADQVSKAIDSANSGMTLSVLAQFVLLGQNGNTGAFALSRDQSDFFLDGLQYVVNLVAGVLNERVVNRFLAINYGDAIDPARVVIKGLNLNKKAGIELANVLATLKNAGAYKATVDDEIQLRQALDMPDLSEDEIEERRATINDPSTTGNQNAIPSQNKNPNDMTEEDMAQARARARGLKFSESPRKKRADYVKKNETEMLDFMRANMMLMKDKMLADINATLNRGQVEIQGLKNIEVSNSKYRKGLEMKLAGLAMESWNMAKAGAKKNNIKLSESINPQDIADKVLKQFVLNQAFSIVDQQSANMLNRAILTASNGSLKGYSVDQTMSNVDKAVKDYIASPGVDVAGSLIVVGTANFGESQFYKEIEDQLWGYRFVAVMDDVTSEICQWYNDKTFSINSPELANATAPLHPNCRSYMEPIYKSESEPTIDDVIAPPSIQQLKTIF